MSQGSMGFLYRVEFFQFYDNYVFYFSLFRFQYDDGLFQGLLYSSGIFIRLNGYQDRLYGGGGRYSMAFNDSIYRDDFYSGYDFRQLVCLYIYIYFMM